MEECLLKKYYEEAKYNAAFDWTIVNKVDK